MYCPYCDGPVVGEKKVVIVVGTGPAHQHCHEEMLLTQRIFNGMNLTNLHSDGLHLLKEMVLTEINSRNQDLQAVEFF